MAEFNRGNLHAQTVGQANNLAVQIATRMGAQSGGQTALTVSIQSVEDGIMVDIGEQAWMGVAASLGQTAISALRNPFSLLGRLDDLAPIVHVALIAFPSARLSIDTARLRVPRTR